MTTIANGRFARSVLWWDDFRTEAVLDGDVLSCISRVLSHTHRSPTVPGTGVGNADRTKGEATTAQKINLNNIDKMQQARATE